MTLREQNISLKWRSTFTYIRLLNKPYVNRVTLREQNISLEWCWRLVFLIYFGKGFRSFHSVDIGSPDQRAVKSLTVKVGSSQKSLPLRPLQPNCVQAFYAQV